MKSGIKEFDVLIEQFTNGKINFVDLISGLWNKGYMAGKEYESEKHKSTCTHENTHFKNLRCDVCTDCGHVVEIDV